MGWPPAVVIVVRHGARLDAADKQWHLTSPTPYDPPLTYGGFNQSKALGARIASILRTRETDDETNIQDSHQNGHHPDGSTKRRRHKVVIHTSPFLRCVQTSIGISAGLAQNPGHMHRSPSNPVKSPAHAAHSPRTRPILSSPLAVQPPKPSQELKKSTIRVDAFLGEWLSPDYFEQITPPPSSIMMVASAKADLLRREDYNLAHHTRENSSSGPNKGFPGGWSPVVENAPESPFSMTTLHHALPRRDRTSSLSSNGHNGTGTHYNGTDARHPLPTALLGEHGVYQPPIPPWAVSSSDQIPQGYIAHARDACVDVDYQWDSMRAPQNWGNGGEYGEEWSSMHKRFRKGLQNLVNWYSEKASPFDLGNKSHSRSNSGEKGCNGNGDSEEEDDDTDLVVILVTHGAGCNALIGALTNHPVLIDVGMASLTMAVRKTVITPKSSPEGSPPDSPSHHSRIGAKVVGISDQYEVKLIANTEHLRPTTSSSTSSRSPSISSNHNGGGREASNFGLGMGSRYPNYPSNGHGNGNGNGINPFESGMTFGSHRNYLSNPLRRSGSGASPSALRTTFSISTTTQNLHRSNSIGLWSATSATAEDEANVLDFGDYSDCGRSEKGVGEQEGGRGSFDGAGGGGGGEKVFDGEESDEVRPLSHGGGAGGLWGSPRPPGDAERGREGGVKRRWTVTENCGARVTERSERVMEMIGRE